MGESTALQRPSPELRLRSEGRIRTRGFCSKPLNMLARRTTWAKSPRNWQTKLDLRFETKPRKCDFETESRRGPGARLFSLVAG